ncbi:sulfatase-like hydrolase/transferase [Bacteroidales bacterium OttesenSCG-928-K03]|nr:sulfatase-like hydrolase/transferase [Bacteroidales bacterium OttesenSCG-928-L14]MDL2240247.1 sulfatase-like hydrolase/transferase [Bacteroidales bacterium OttesenSCG-928-K22]MDL2242417.1 sulfatase-like hydrolase/transferase [Bacteroidales bacterium OttesenSCG-928-K03]
MKNKRLSSFLYESLFSYLNIGFWFLLTAIGLRLLETILLTVTAGELGLNCLNNFYGIFIDILVFAKYSLALLPIFFLIYYFSRKGAQWFLRILLSLMVLISISLIYYYLTAGIPLDKVFFMYSLQDIIGITISSKSMAWWEYIILICLPLFFLFISGKKIKIHKTFIFIFLSVVVLSLIIKDIPSTLYKSHSSYNTISNKFDYFIKNLFVKENDTLEINDIDNSVLKLQSYFPENDFLGSEYPFLYKDLTPDVLSDYFNLQETPPNIVVIIVEGLGRTICGENSLYPSATHFLDSLASQALYWENCFSSSHRTVCALPTIFGALPFGEKGFLDLKNSAPEFFSFPLIFKDNAYELSFFYGGWIGFDDMNFFLELNKFDNYINKSLYNTHEEKNNWGLFDHALFNEAFKILDSSNNQCRLDIYLTLTTHKPYDYPNKDYYMGKYQDIVQKQNLTMTKTELQGKASFMYFDDCLRQLINLYKEKPKYENTIFIITGDHNHSATSDYWRNCHVPLIIWSPMIKESKKISALASHRDIAPSLISLMKNNFNFISPEYVTWLNSGLDTVSHFRSKTFTPQFNTTRSLSDIIYHDRYINNGKIDRFIYKENTLSLENVANDNKLFEFLKLYKNIDKYVVEKDKLVINEFNSNNYNIINVFNITETKDVLKYYKSKTTSTYHNKDNTLHFVNSIYPFNILNYEIPNENIQNIKVEFSFDIFIKDTSFHHSEKQLYIVTDISDKNKICKYWGVDNLFNTYMYKNYDNWESFSFNFDIKKKNYLYSEGDILKIYIWNKHLNEFYLSNFNLKVDNYQKN